MLRSVVIVKVNCHLNVRFSFCLVHRCNTSLLIDYCRSDGDHRYILIDVGKTFREQVLRWFTRYKIPRVDSVSPHCAHFVSRISTSYDIGTFCMSNWQCNDLVAR